jgi:hypothetical protein
VPNRKASSLNAAGVQESRCLTYLCMSLEQSPFSDRTGKPAGRHVLTNSGTARPFQQVEDFGGLLPSPATVDLATATPHICEIVAAICVVLVARVSAAQCRNENFLAQQTRDYVLVETHAAPAIPPRSIALEIGAASRSSIVYRIAIIAIRSSRPFLQGSGLLQLFGRQSVCRMMICAVGPAVNGRARP